MEAGAEGILLCSAYKASICDFRCLLNYLRLTQHIRSCSLGPERKLGIFGAYPRGIPALGMRGFQNMHQNSFAKRLVYIIPIFNTHVWSCYGQQGVSSLLIWGAGLKSGENRSVTRNGASPRERSVIHSSPSVRPPHIPNDPSSAPICER